MQLILLWVLFLFPALVKAEQTDDSLLAESKMIDDSHAIVSTQLHQWIDGIDQFFGEERALEKQNTSQVLLRLQTTRFKDSLYWEPKVRARLDLPRTKRRLRLMLSSESFGDSDEDLDSPVSALEESLGDSLNQASFSAALQFIITTKDWLDINTRAGVSYYNIAPDPFLSARASTQTRFLKWNFRLTQNVYLYARQGFGEELDLDIERKVANRFLLRFNNQISWWQEFGEFHAVQTMSSIVPITSKFAMSFVGISQQLPERDWQVEANYVYAVARYRFYKHWAYFQLKPQLEYLREDDFRQRWSVTTGIEMIFGKKTRSPEMEQKMEDLDRPD